MSTSDVGTQTDASWFFVEDEGFVLIETPQTRTYGIPETRLARARLAGYRVRDFLDGEISSLPSSRPLELKDRYHVLVRGCDSCGHSGITTSLKTLRRHTAGDAKSISHSFPSLTESRIFWGIVQGTDSEHIPQLADSCTTAVSDGK